MPSADIPFHATPQEISSWVSEWQKQHSLTLIRVQFPPISYREISHDEIYDAIVHPETTDVLLLTSRFDPPVRFQREFFDLYPDYLTLRIGHVSNAGLGESWLAYKTKDVNNSKIWRRIVFDVKDRTKSGVTYTNAKSGNTAFLKRNRYSDGAEGLESRGTPMLPFVADSGSKIRLGDCRK